jgi:hypothetical protein
MGFVDVTFRSVIAGNRGSVLPIDSRSLHVLVLLPVKH